MDTKKTSKKSSKTAEITAAVVEQPVADSKPMKRASAVKKTKTESPVAAKPSTSRKTSHKHSKLAVPPVVPANTTAEVAPPAFVPPTHDEIAKLAYKFYEERNYADGFANEDWHRAITVLTATGR